MASEAGLSITTLVETVGSQKALVSDASFQPLEQLEEKVDVPKVPDCVQRIKANRNPFKLPRDCDIFTLRDIEREEKRKEKEGLKKLKIYEKVTYAARVNAKQGKPLKEEEELEVDPEAEHQANVKKLSALKSDPSWKVKITRDRHIEKETLNDYIHKKREMFTLEYSLTMKKDEIRKLEEAAAVEELKLQTAERYLEEDATMFDEFLKENDKNSVQAMQIAEQETKLKLEKVAELKKLSTQLMSVKNDIVKFEETLKDYRVYRDFLMKLSPKEWRDNKEKKKKEIKLAKVSSREIVRKAPPTVISRQASKTGAQPIGITRQGSVVTKTVADWRKSSAISIESKPEDQEWSDSDEDKMLESLDQKVMEVYRSCIGENEANMSTLQMLTSIENYLEDLLENLEKLPREKVELAEKNKEKEKRMRLREEKLREEKLHQEERVHRAMLRSQAEHQKKTGRKLVYRSEPPPIKELKQQVQDTTDQQKEEEEYYFNM
ncbi:cilia- and flagella-associated protein 100 isoform X2 [Rhinoraja longicauda]